MSIPPDINDSLLASAIKAANGSEIIHRVANDPEGSFIETLSGPTPSIKEWFSQQEVAIGDEVAEKIESVTEQVGLAEAAADRSESSASLAAAFHNPFLNTTDGIGNTSGSGASNRFFSVLVAGSSTLYTAYRNDAGLAVNIGQLPSATEVAALSAIVRPAAVLTHEFQDQFGNASVGITEDGQLQASDVRATALAFDVLALRDDEAIPSIELDEVVDAYGSVSSYVDRNGTHVVGRMAAEVFEVSRLVVGTQTSFHLTTGFTGVLHYGQSLSQGSNSTPPFSVIGAPYSYMFNGGVRAQDGGAVASVTHASLVPHVEQVSPINPILGETPAYGFQQMLYQLIAERFPVIDPSVTKLISSAPGMGGAAIAQLSKGGQQYAQLLEDIDYGVSLSNALGEQYAVGAITWTQGEQDQSTGTSAASYITQLLQIHQDANADLKVRTRQPNPVPIITYQNGSWRRAGGSYPTIALAQLEASELYPDKIIMACPMYQFDYIASDDLHLPTGESRRYGAYLAIAHFFTVLKGVPFQPLKPIAVQGQGSLISVKFNVPHGVLELDTWLVAQATNYGFSVVDNVGAAITISSVEIRNGDTVLIRCAAAVPSGSHLRYGFGGTTDSGRNTGPRGNLRDQQGSQIVFNGDGSPMHNWCVFFDKTIN
jgi:hypothetical protein